MRDIFTGALVRLAAVVPEAIAAPAAEWNRDSEYMRLLDSDPPRLFSANAIRQWIEKQSAKDPTQYSGFAIRSLGDDALIGHTSLFGFLWNHRSAWLGIGIGRRDLWGKGYGTDTVGLMLRYAFSELNLRRVQLSVFDYNPRAIRSYESAGFRLEGILRRGYARDGVRFDELFMAVLYEDWTEANKTQP